MTGSAGLERRYRRLLAWYPRAFREAYAEEMAAVMMAGASQGQARPRARESVNLLRNAIWARLRPARPARPNPTLQDALALFSLIAPVFLVVVAALEVAFGFRLPASPIQFLSHREVDGLALLAQPGFDIAAGSLLLVAAAAALGMRRLALAAAGLAVLYAVGLRYATSNGYGLPLPLEMLATSGCLLEVVALIASPGPRRGRELVRWKHAVVLVLAAGAVHVSTIMVTLTWLPKWLLAARPATNAYLLTAALLAAAAAGLAAAFRLNRYLLLLLAGMLYPWAFQVVASAAGGPVLLAGTWVAVPGSLLSLVYLYLPPLLLACAIAVRATQSRRTSPETA